MYHTMGLSVVVDSRHRNKERRVEVDVKKTKQMQCSDCFNKCNDDRCFSLHLVQ